MKILWIFGNPKTGKPLVYELNDDLTVKRKILLIRTAFYVNESGLPRQTAFFMD